MKKLITILYIALAPLALSAQTFTFTGPESSNRGADGKIVRSGYITNNWYDNWVIYAGAGAQTMVSGFADNGNRGFDLGTAVITPAYEVAIAKWVTPGVAVRFGIQGLELIENRKFQTGGFWNHYIPKYDDSRMYYGQTYMHADIFFSLTNALGGYKEHRFFNITPYFNAGYLRLYHPDYGITTKEMRDREMALGFGVLNTLRITKHLGLNIDLRWSNFAGRFHDVSNGGRVQNFTALGGLSYTIHKWYWNRFDTAQTGYETAIAAEKALRDADARRLAESVSSLDDAKAALESTNRQLDAARRAIDELTRQLELEREGSRNCDKKVVVEGDELLTRIANADLVIFFDKNVDRPGSTELIHLDEYIRKIRQIDPAHVFYITGSADKGTGNDRINTRLSKNRAENIKRIMMRKYGIPESQIVIKATIISDKHEDGSLDRCVLFENE